MEFADYPPSSMTCLRFIERRYPWLVVLMTHVLIGETPQFVFPSLPILDYFLAKTQLTNVTEYTKYM